MKKLPPDIEHKIDFLFHDLSDRQYVKNLMLGLWDISLNVGADQMARSIIFLAEGNVSMVKDIFEREFYGDPRDVIMMAEKKSGNPGHFFMITFDEINNMGQ